jgi:hypothetical protein
MCTGCAIRELILRHSHLKIQNEPHITLESIQECMWITQPLCGLCWCFVVAQMHLEDGLMCVSFTQNHVNTELSAQIDEFRAKYPNVG